LEFGIDCRRRRPRTPSPGTIAACEDNAEDQPMRLLWTALILAVAGPARGDGELAPPVRLLAGGSPIDVDVGHAAPFVADLDGDGVRHLLVGQFGDGKLRIYRNAGDKRGPRFDRFTWLLDGAPGGRVPAS
jgi:hypothetical protein